MHYQVAYDILVEGYQADNVVTALVLVLLPLFVMFAVGRGERRKGTRKWWIGLIVPSFLFVVFSGLVVHFLVLQGRAKEWARTGEYDVAEGAFSGFQYFAKSSFFEVGGVRFGLPKPPFQVGFRGELMGAGAETQLRPGVPVRVAHRNGIVLRVEVAEPRSKPGT